jgi:hypothetical protein
MAARKKSPKKKPRKSRAARPKPVRATFALSTLEARVAKLEARLRAQDAVLELVGGGACTTVRIKGNLQVVNGMGSTNTLNGCGNLIIGYNEAPPASSGWPSTRSGSHNIILGRYHSHASYAGLLSGEMNLTSVNAPSACVVGGSEGSANADRVVIVGGHEGKGNGARAVVIGGFDNGATGAGNLSVCIGGTNNRTDASSSTLLGGSGLTTSAPGQRIPP